MANESSFYGTAISTRGTPLVGQSVAICSQPANTSTTPCSPLVTTYTDITGSTPTGTPGITTTDSFGNFHFYLPSGVYTVQIYGPQVASPVVQKDFFVPSGTSSDNTFTGTTTFTGNVLLKYFETSRIVDAANTAGWAGADFPAWLNSAYADCPTPASGQIPCKIEAFPTTNGTCYTATTLINLAVSGKPVDIDFHGACLNYGAVTSGTVLTVDVGQGPATGWRISNLKLLGPCATTACTGVTTVGINLGPANGAVGGLLDNVQVGTAGGNNGFLNNWKVNSAAFFTQCRNCYAYGGNIGVNETNGVEGWKWIGGVIGQNATALQTAGSGSKSEYIATQFDDNTTTNYNRQPSTTFDVDFISCHWENAGLGALVVLTDTGSGGAVRYIGGDIQDDRTTLSDTQLMSFGGTFISVQGLSIFSAGHTYTQAITLSGSATAYLNFIFKSPSLITNSYNPAYAGRVWDNSFYGATAQTQATFNFFNIQTNGVLQWEAAGSAADSSISRLSAGSLAIGTGAQGSTAGTLTANQFNSANFNATGNLFLSGTPTPTAGNAVCGGPSGTLKCSYNNGTTFQISQTIGTGNVTTAGTAINTLTCQAQTAITVTGAATTDNVMANIGAALPATWQTGIVLSAHVTATNTVTVYLCNPTATATITPIATQVNVRVVR